MRFRTEGAADHVSGVILFDETIRQKAADGTPLVELLEKQGVIPGIKVDAGAKALAFSEGETVTEGLDGLRERLAEYRELGARFAKWRATYSIDTASKGGRRPTEYCLDVNAHALARYAALCQEAGIVPIVEPEILMDGDHTIEESFAVTTRVLRECSASCRPARDPRGHVVSPTWCCRGYDGTEQASVESVADHTVRCFRLTVPAVPASCSPGGQSEARHRAPNDERSARTVAAQLLVRPCIAGTALKAWSGKPTRSPPGRLHLSAPASTAPHVTACTDAGDRELGCGTRWCSESPRRGCGSTAGRRRDRAQSCWSWASDTTRRRASWPQGLGSAGVPDDAGVMNLGAADVGADSWS
jgi:fructose-bisphosphate aldolase class I